MTQNSNEKNAVMSAMLNARATRAEIRFSGGGDEGGADQITLTYADGGTKDLGIYEKGLSSLLSDIPSWKYYSFADGGGFHVDGTITVDVAKNSVVFECTEEIAEDHYITEAY